MTEKTDVIKWHWEPPHQQC